MLKYGRKCIRPSLSAARRDEAIIKNQYAQAYIHKKYNDHNRQTKANR